MTEVNYAHNVAGQKISKEEYRDNLRKFYNALTADELSGGNCCCKESYINPSWASVVHGISFHVCKKHALEFLIPLTPVWRHEIEALMEDK